MPRISHFFGITILMYVRDHLPPHFHARHGDFEAQVSLLTFELLEGRLPPRVTGLVLEWATLHRQELMDNWERARRRMPLSQIAPLR